MEIKLNETVRERQGILIGIFICFNYLYFNFIFICGNTASEKIYRNMLDRFTKNICKKKNCRL